MSEDADTQPAPWTPESIIAQFEADPDRYQRAAVDAALAQRDAVIRVLIEVMRDVHRNPDDTQYTIAYIYAFFLLGHFRAVEAHPTLLEIGHLDKEVQWNLYGDLVTEDYFMVLLSTCGGDFSGIKQLAEDTSANMFARSAAAHALITSVMLGLADRDDVLHYCRELLEREMAVDSEFASLLANDLLDLRPVELLPLFERGYAEESLDPTFTTLDHMKQILDEGWSDHEKRIQDQLQHYSLDDVHASMSGMNWPGDRPPVTQLLPPPKPSSDLFRLSNKSLAAQKAQKKKKRKTADASRKRNRRK